jgi:hypothetical protein
LRDSRIEAELERLQLRYRWRHVATDVGSHALVVAAVVLLCDALPRMLRALLPAGLTTWALVLGGAWLLWVTGRSLQRHRLSALQADRALALQDRLVTWDGARRAGVKGRMFDWLDEDLGDRLAAVPEERAQRLVRAPMGWLRYLIPLLIVFWLLREFAPILPPRIPWPDRGPPRPESDGGRQGGGGERGAGGQRPPDRSQPPDTPPRPGDAPNRPMTQLPPQDALVVPQYVGDGPTRQELARQALVEAGPPRPAAGAGAASTPAPPPPDREEYRRQLEEALRARHLPEAERPIVRRYFENLIGERQ